MTPSARPTIVFLHPSDELYGADRQLLALVRETEPLARPFVVLPDDLPYAGALSEALRAEGFEVRRGPLPVLRRAYGKPGAVLAWLARTLAGTWWVFRIARRERPELIVSNSGAIPVGPLVARALGCRHVWFVREIIGSPRWFRGLLVRVSRLAQGSIVTVSRAVADWLGPVPGRGPEVVHDGVRVSDEPADLPDAPSAVFVGRLNDWKGWDVFVDAAAMAHRAVPDARFVVVGGTAPTGPIDASAVDRRIASADMSPDRLTWVGEQADGRGWMRDAWLVAVPSKRPDPFPNVVLEAMAEGRAVVGSASGGIAEMVVDGETGRLVPPGDAGALGGAMVRLLSDRSEARRMGRAGHQRVRERFSEGAFADRWRSLLHDELGR